MYNSWKYWLFSKTETIKLNIIKLLCNHAQQIYMVKAEGSSWMTDYSLRKEM